VPLGQDAARRVDENHQEQRMPKTSAIAELVCESCGTKFPRGERGRAARFCSVACRKKQQIPASLCCGECGENFVAKKFRKFCSPDCQVAAFKKARTKTVDCVCENCGEGFWPKRPSRNKFCSRDCAYSFKAKRAAENNAGAFVPCDTQCSVCSRVFFRRQEQHTYCSPDCSKQAHTHRRRLKRGPKQRACIVCSSQFTRKPGQGSTGKYCSRKCSNKAAKRRRWLTEKIADRMRKQKLAAGDRINPYEIFARDNWTCHICSKPVDRNAKCPADLAATLDHLIPLSKNGPHIKTNVRCAHFICNCRRGNRGSYQMPLFG
jgi:hypothetical protein